MLRFSESTAMGTASAQAGVGINFDDSLSRDHYLISMDGTYSWTGATIGEGPIQLIINHADYSTAEVLEWWNATSQWDTSDKVAQEQSRRKCRHVGSAMIDSISGSLNDGKPMRTKLKFVVEAGQTLALTGINDSSAGLTTGMLIQATGKIYAKPL